jgi:hypothetical protein
VLIGIYLSRLLAEYRSAPELSIAEPQTGVVVESNNVRVVGQAEPSSVVSINNLAVSVDENGNFQEMLYLQDGTNKVLVRAEEGGKVTERELVIQANVPAEGGARGGRPVVVKLEPEVNKESWVRIVADGKQVYEGILNNGMVVEADTYVYLLAGNAGALDVTYNGVPRGSLGGSGEVVHEVFGDAPAELKGVRQAEDKVAA